MLLRPSNTLLLDEPTNHLDLDSKEVLLDALVDYGGTLIFVSHDRYFVERLATKIVEIGHGTATVYPGTYTEFLWHKTHAGDGGLDPKRPAADIRKRSQASAPAAKAPAADRPDAKAGPGAHDRKKREDAEARRRQRADAARKSEIDTLEAQIARCEQAIREIEQTMAAPGFYEDRAAAQPIIDRHQALMWEVGDLMHRWEELQLHKTVI
jgi:ATP-binding cassette subfamily F protein 3